MDQSEIKEALIRFVTTAISVLSVRVLTWAAMLLSAAMFGFVLWQPDPIRLATATIFAVLVFWRITTIDQKGKDK